MLVTTLALAQYVWIDEKGLRQYSDRPPPQSVPLKRILKAPDLSRLQQEASKQVATVSEAQSALTPAPAAPTLAERNAAFLKRRADQAENEKKAAEEAARKADAVSRCEDLRKSKLLDDTGIRIAIINQQGERDVMSDEERAQRRKKILAALEKCPK